MVNTETLVRSNEMKGESPYKFSSDEARSECGVNLTRSYIMDVSYVVTSGRE